MLDIQANLSSPRPRSRGKIKSRPKPPVRVFSKPDLKLHRYPDQGPLDIKNHQRYLDITKEYFLTHYGKSGPGEVNMDQFTLLCELGQGTFGTVVLARHEPSEIDYSIKFISKAKLVKLKQVQQALQEKKIMQGLNSPFTIYLAYFFMDNSYIYFVLPYIEGGELFDYIVKLGRLDEEQARFFLSQVVLGLEYIHNLDLIYRDLKPENILIDRTGYLKLIDFGFSKLVKNHRTYTFCGTPDYMAPEIILNKGHGPPADWWAAGILLYEMVAGTTPFHHKEKIRIYEKIVTNSYKMPYTFSTGLKDLVKNLLQTETSKRYGNLKGGVDDIKQHKWFRPINWLAILNRTVIPEYIPSVELVGNERRGRARKPKVEVEDKFADVFKEFDDNNFFETEMY